MVGMFVLWIGLCGHASAKACHQSQPCGEQCIPWDQPCRVDAPPGSRKGWQIPWEWLDADAARIALFTGVYSMLVFVARQRSIGPREV